MITRMVKIKIYHVRVCKQLKTMGRRLLGFREIYKVFHVERFVHIFLCVLMRPQNKLCARGLFGDFGAAGGGMLRVVRDGGIGVSRMETVG